MRTGASWHVAAFVAVSAAFSPTLWMPMAAHAAPIAPAQGTPRETVGSYELGVRALATNDLVSAQQHFEQALIQDPKRVKAVLALAEIARMRADPVKTESYLRRAATIAPADSSVQIAMAKWFNSNNRADEAIAALEKATRLDPSAAMPWVDLGVLYARVPKTREKAVAAFSESLKRDGTLAGAHFALGTVLADVGKVDEAVAELNTAARLKPDDPRPWTALGHLYADRAELRKASAAYGHAIELDPSNVAQRIALGELELRARRFEIAADVFTKVTDLSPENDGGWVRLGLVRERQGRAPDAELAYRKAISLNPRQAVALNNLAMILTVRKGDLDEALALAQRAVDISPNSAFLGALNRVYVARGEMPNAADAAARAAKAAQKTATRNSPT